ncbi:MAG TPA: hypothetical protein VGR57_18825 [Ktedonobacterales bacterium]|nr:hypothetical protein [Ktedonobacterales bacterium]
MDPNELLNTQSALMRLARAAREDREVARQIRQLIIESGILQVFGEGENLNLLDTLEAGGGALLRTRLAALSVAQLKHLVTVYQFDAEKATVRWRSASRLVEFITAQAVEMWQQMDRERVLREEAVISAAPQPAVPAGAASWML